MIILARLFGTNVQVACLLKIVLLPVISFTLHYNASARARFCAYNLYSYYRLIFHLYARGADNFTQHFHKWIFRDIGMLARHHTS